MKFPKELRNNLKAKIRIKENLEKKIADDLAEIKLLRDSVDKTLHDIIYDIDTEEDMVKFIKEVGLDIDLKWVKNAWANSHGEFTDRTIVEWYDVQHNVAYELKLQMAAEVHKEEKRHEKT